MDNSKHLWNPISIRTEQTLRLSHALALEHLDMYLDNASNGGAGTFSDQNIAAQLVRLQAGLRDEQVRRVQDAPSARDEEIATEAVGAEKSSKKRKRERKLQEAQSGAAADSSVADVTTGEADVVESSQPAKKKRKDKSKSKVKLESSQSAQQ